MWKRIERVLGGQVSVFLFSNPWAVRRGQWPSDPGPGRDTGPPCLLQWALCQAPPWLIHPSVQQVPYGGRGPPLEVLGCSLLLQTGVRGTRACGATAVLGPGSLDSPAGLGGACQPRPGAGVGSVPQMGGGALKWRWRRPRSDMSYQHLLIEHVPCARLLTHNLLRAHSCGGAVWSCTDCTDWVPGGGLGTRFLHVDCLCRGIFRRETSSSF